MSMKGFIIYFTYSLKMKHDRCKCQQWKNRKKKILNSYISNMYSIHHI